MKLAAWVALALLILSMLCGMWLVAAIATNLLVPNAAGRLTPGETLVGGIICSIGPFALAFASAMVWWFGVRGRAARPPSVPAQAQVAAPPPAPAAPRSARGAEVSQPSEPQALLDAYLDKITEILFRCGWPAEALGTDVRGIIQAETRRMLMDLGPAGRSRVLLFLQRAGLLKGDEPINLYGVDLRFADLRFADLSDARLAGVGFQQARLTGADLRGCELSDANLCQADLRIAQLDRATLDRANLQQAHLHRASLRGASLHHADLRDANLWEADLKDARMVGAQVQMESHYDNLSNRRADSAAR